MKRFRRLIMQAAMGYLMLESSFVALAKTPAEIGQNACNTIGNDAAGCGRAGGGLFGAGGIFSNLISAVIVVAGAASVIMIVIGGLRYVLSGGDAAGIKSAKDTILYALVGLVVAILAYGIVAFVINRVG